MLYRPVDFGHHLLKCGIIGFSLIKSATGLGNAQFTKPVPLADRLLRGADAFMVMVVHQAIVVDGSPVAFGCGFEVDKKVSVGQLGF
jgi:hypothetical protein